MKKEGKMGRQVKKMVLLAAIGIISIVFFPSSSQAAKGWLLGAGIGAAIPSMSGDLGENFKVGEGSYLDVGYGFNKYFMLGGYFGSDFCPGNSSLNDNVAYTLIQPNAGIYGRFTIDVGKNLEPYANIGIGAYSLTAAGSNLLISSKSPTLGFKFGGGLNWFLGKDRKWFIGPELAYHYVPYDQDFGIADIGAYDVPDTTIRIKGNANVFELLFKFGYQWKK
jgi:hypothetical protein